MEFQENRKEVSAMPLEIQPDPHSANLEIAGYQVVVAIPIDVKDLDFCRPQLFAGDAPLVKIAISIVAVPDDVSIPRLRSHNVDVSIMIQVGHVQVPPQ